MAIARYAAYAGTYTTPDGAPFTVAYWDGYATRAANNAERPRPALGTPGRWRIGWYIERPGKRAEGPYTSSQKAYVAAGGSIRKAS